MKPRVSALILLLFVALVLGSHPALADPGWAGLWSGKVTFKQQSVTVLFNVTDGDAGWSGTFDSPEQMVLGLPFSKVQATGDSVELEIERIDFHYQGHLSSDGQSATGTVHQHGLDLPLNLQRLHRPQTPHGPFPYEERKVDCPGPGGLHLAGTLTVPASPHPAPAVLLIAGPGPHDRDETIFGHHLFWVLADYLSRNGWAVLRMDKRGCGQSGGNYATATTRDFADDAQAEYRFLSSQPDIDSHRVGLLGHSEGGLEAPMVAASDATVAFVILFAGPGQPCDQLMIKQDELAVQMAGATPQQVKDVTDANRHVFAIIRNSSNLEQARKQIEKGAPKLAQAIDKQLTPWFYAFARTDPAPALRRTRCPVLALDGSKDVQVYADDNLRGIADTLAAAHHPDFTVAKLPGLNHLFQTAPTGKTSEYAEIEETVAPQVLTTVLDWLQTHTASGAGR